jgi:hypothetical protein
MFVMAILFSDTNFKVLSRHTAIPFIVTVPTAAPCDLFWDPGRSFLSGTPYSLLYPLLKLLSLVVALTELNVLRGYGVSLWISLENKVSFSVKSAK